MLRSRRPPALLAFALLLLGLPLLGLPATAATSPTWHAWSGTPTDVFRTGQYDRGEWIYTNGVRQARGANSDRLERADYYAAVKPSPTDPTNITDDLYNALTYDFFGAHRAAHNGDYQLPADLPDGTPEIAELRLAVDGSDLYVRTLWTSFPLFGAQVATLTFAPAAALPAASPWPRGARLSGAWTTALTLSGLGASVTREGTTTPVASRASGHVVEARVPLSALPAGPWHLQGGSGLGANPDLRTGTGVEYRTVPAGSASATEPGSGGPTSPTNVWGLLFAGDSPWSFDELSQSRQLTTGVATSYAVVDPKLLAAKASRPAPLLHGNLTRLLHSAQPSRDGIRKDRSGTFGTPPITPPIPVPDFNVSYFYEGALQDYSMHVPSSYDGTRATPLVVYLHGYTGLPEEAFRNPTGLIDAVDKKGWLLASALGRGDWFYRGGTPGEADVLEVLKDVSRRYRVDPDRIYLMGHSMGGYGTNNLATHHPDLFAAVAPAEGTDSADLSANLRNTPWLEMTAEEDLDTQAKNAKALYARLSTAGYDATLLDYQLKIHEYSSIYDTLPRLMSFFAGHTRQQRPAVVTWTRPVGQDNKALGQKYDGAWWLRGVEPAAGVTRPTVTVESMALPHAALDPTAATRTDAMVDEGGPSGRTKAQLLQTVPARAAAPVQPGHLRVTAVGARAATVRVADAGVATGRSLTITSAVDHDLTLGLVGDTRTFARFVDGVRAGTARGSVVLPSGTHTVLLTVTGSGAPAAGPAAGPGAGPAPSRSLPVTGASLWAGVGLVLTGLVLTGLLLSTRRRRTA